MNKLDKLNDYYNKFNEDKRLLSRHGIVEFRVTTSFIDKYLKENDSIVDIGAGSGRYSVYYKNKGHEVLAVEPLSTNVGKIKRNDSQLKVLQASATNLNKVDKEYDVALMFGPMYHLLNKEDKIKAINEVRRIVKNNGLIFIAYLRSDYCLIKHGLLDNNFSDLNNNLLKDEIIDNDGLYCYVSDKYIEEIDKELNLKVIDKFTQEGISDFIRNYLNKLNDDEFENYIRYIIKMASDISISSHIVEVIKNEK